MEKIRFFAVRNNNGEPDDDERVYLYASCVQDGGEGGDVTTVLSSVKKEQKKKKEKMCKAFPIERRALPFRFHTRGGVVAAVRSRVFSRKK